MVLTFAAVTAGTISAAAPAADEAPRLRVSWGSASIGAQGNSMRDATYRVVVRPSTSGDAVRVRLSNALGSAPLTFASARVAVRAPEVVDGRTRGAGTIPGTDRRLTFDGAEEVTIPPGKTAYSDVVGLDVRAQTDLAVSLYVEEPQQITAHNTTSADQPTPTQYATDADAGDHTGDESTDAFAARGTDIRWVDALDVRTVTPGAVVALGDSITAGCCGDGPDSYTTYPDFLSRRLGALPEAETASVINEGIGGNTVRALEARLERDVLSQTGVTHVILLIGTNDLTLGATAEDVIAGITRIADRLAGAGIKTIGGTITPREPLSTPIINLYRHQINDFVRADDRFTDVADFDAALRDPADPERMREEFIGTGDGVHPNARGFKAMGDAVDLAPLRTRAPESRPVLEPTPAPAPSSAPPREHPAAPAPAIGAAPTAPATASTRGGRARPQRVTARVTRRRTGRGLRLVSSGAVLPPPGADRAVACRGGRVSVQVKAGRRTVSARRARLRADCGYRAEVRFGSPRRLAGVRRLRIQVRFLGTAALRPRRAAARSVSVA